MEFLEIFDYVFWVPLIFWVALYFWFYRCAYPLHLHKMVKKGKKWAFLSASSSELNAQNAKIRILNILISLIASVALAFSCCWALFRLEVCDPVFGFIALALGPFLALVLYRIAMSKISSIFESAYFLEYRRARYQIESKGEFLEQEDIHNRTVWSFNKKLRHAQEHHRFWKYVNAMAKTKKIPPDIYAETMY